MHFQSASPETVPLIEHSRVTAARKSATPSQQGLPMPKSVNDDQLEKEITSLCARIPKRTLLFLMDGVSAPYHSGVGYNGSVFVSPTQLPNASEGSMSPDWGVPSKPSPKSTTPKDDPSHLSPLASQSQPSSTINALGNRDSFAFLGGQFDGRSPSDMELDLRGFETSCDKDLTFDGDSWDIMLHLPVSTSI